MFNFLNTKQKSTNTTTDFDRFFVVVVMVIVICNASIERARVIL